MSSIKKYIFIPVFIIALGAVFSLGFFIGQTSRPSVEKVEGLCNKTLNQPAEVDFSLFWDAWSIIQQKYVDRDQLNPQQMVYGAISGLVKSLDDPYSVFMPPEESKQFLDDMGGSFEGIGAEIGIRKGVLTIIAPLEDSPAQNAGLQAGDKILKVDDTLTADLTLDEAVRLIRGPKGTPVVLLISREGWEEAKEITVIRDTIKIPILKWEMKEDIAYIQFYHFTENSAGEFRKIVKQIFKEQPKGLILDLRNNPGGYLEVAVDIASWFLPKGEIVAIEDFGNGEKIEYRSKGYKELADIPTVILLNQGSASASEIVAGALQDHLDIKIVGEKSFGKGSVQELEKLRGGSSIKITIAKWLTPKGICIQEKGIEPDVEVEMTQEDFDQGRDPQLEKALELLE
jgi:carboxyl-terminal processing protease